MSMHIHEKLLGIPRLLIATRTGRTCCLVAASLLTFGTAAAQDGFWIGQPTTRDYLANNVRKGIEQFGQLRQQILQFNAEIADARKAYFSASSANRAAAGENFGALLFQKDLLIAMPQVTAGDSDAARLVSNITELAGGGVADGGIAPSARTAFDKWVSALQFQSGSVFGPSANPARAASALQGSESMKEYQTYRQLRDQAEKDEWEALSKGTPRKLIGPGMKYSLRSFMPPTKRRGFDEQTQQVTEKVLVCTYAGKGRPFYFWDRQPPANIDMLLAMNSYAGSGGLNALRDHAVEQCPPNDTAADAIASAMPRVNITSEMKEKARTLVDMNSADIATQERNNQESALRIEEQKKKNDDKLARGGAMNAALRQCQEDYRATGTVVMEAYKSTHDKAALQAARLAAQQTSKECSVEARKLLQP